MAPVIATVVANMQPLLAAGLAHALLGVRLGAAGYLVAAFARIPLITTPRLLNGAEPGFGAWIAYLMLAAIGLSVAM